MIKLTQLKKNNKNIIKYMRNNKKKKKNYKMKIILKIILK